MAEEIVDEKNLSGEKENIDSPLKKTSIRARRFTKMEMKGVSFRKSRNALSPVKQ